MQVDMEIHDIIKGDEPQENGYYLMFRQDVDGLIGIEPMYWDTETKAWSMAKEADGFLLPTSYWGRYWTENFLKAVRI